MQWPVGKAGSRAGKDKEKNPQAFSITFKYAMQGLGCQAMTFGSSFKIHFYIIHFFCQL